MSAGAGLDDLGGAIGRCIREIEGAQSALRVARDRAQAAQQIIAITGEGSSNDLIASAMAIIAQVDVELEAAAATYVSAVDSLQQYAAQKQLGAGG